MSAARAAALVLAVAAAGCGGGGGGGSPSGCTLLAGPNGTEPGPSPSCSPPQSPTITAASAVAGPATDPGTCQKPIVPSALAAAQVQHFGVLPVNSTVSFQVPAGTGSFTVLLQAQSAPETPVTFAGTAPLSNMPVPLTITDPAGGKFYDDADGACFPADFSQATALHLPGQSGTSAFTVPNTSRALAAWGQGVPAGTWKFVVGDYAAECANLGSSGCSAGGSTQGTYDVSVLLRPGPVQTTGTIDVKFYLVGTTLDAATAATDPGMVRMVSTLATILAQAGLCLGQVTFVDVPAWARAKYATGVDAASTGPCSDYSQLLTLSVPDASIAIFLVDDILSNGSGGLHTVGLDGAVPGPSSAGGTIVSGAVVNDSNIGHGTCGAAVSFGSTGCGSDFTALVAAHEIGHWLGLYHTTERPGTVFDPVADTGTCACHACASACTPTTAMMVSQCTQGGSCTGGDNLMFWLAGGDALSAQQGQVMRANPAVH